jgi:hypothetical protein
MGLSVGDSLRRVRSGFGPKGARSKGLNSILLLSLIIVLSISVTTSANNEGSSVSANCDICHAPSIYLVVDIQFVDAPLYLTRNDTGTINVTIEVSSSHKSYVWSGFGMDVWLSAGTDHTDCGPHQILNGQKPRGQSSPYIWKETFSFVVRSSLNGTETIIVNARMSPVHESPPVTARSEKVIQVVSNKDDVIIPIDGPVDDDIPVEDERDRARAGPLGLIIMITGALALLGGVLYVAYSLIAPVEDGRYRGKKGRD